jgi:molybdopterin-guanine dinucleotide biosynthesis protein A
MQTTVGGIVLTGGGGVRLQGADKATIEIGGQTLLEHALAALRELAETVVVGDWLPTSRPVTFLREEPAGGGPAAGVLAGLAGFPRLPQIVVALAVDMPMVTTATVRRLVAALEADPGLDGVLLDGRQYLCAAYRPAALQEAAARLESSYGASMRQLLSSLSLGEVAALGAEARDVDTFSDLRELRELLAEDADVMDS